MGVLGGRMSVWGAAVGLGVLGLAVVALLVTGCSNEEPQRTEKLNTQLTTERDTLREEKESLQDRIVVLEAEVDGLQAELERVRKASVISQEHVLLERARTADENEDFEAALADYETFVAHFPKSKSRGLVEKRLKVLRGELAQEQKEEEERALAAELDHVRISEVFANLKRYKGRVIRRSVRCHSATEALGRYPFSSNCEVQSDSSAGLRILYSNADLALLADLDRDGIGRYEYAGHFKIVGHSIDDVEVKFVGLDE